MELFALAKTLVNMDSVTGREGPCAQFLGHHLSRKLHLELQPVSAGRWNVLAFRGTPEITLSTHIDTVPPFMPAGEDGEFIYGRGSCDAKGIVAAQIAAAERLLAEGVNDFGLLFLVGEETISDGAAAANLTPRGSKYMINGEPTENKLVLGTKGILWINIRVKGKMAHSAYPHLGDSAVEKLLDILEDLRKLPLPDDPVFGPATLNIGRISGGRAANVIADEACAQILIRTVPIPPGEPDLRCEIERLLDGRCEYEFARDTPALRLEGLDGFDTDIVAFTTDLSSLTAWGRPLLLGPGSIAVAHTEHERVRKADLARAVDLYCRLVKELKSRR